MFKKNKQLLIGILIGILITSISPVSAAIEQYTLRKSPFNITINEKDALPEHLPMLFMEPGYNYIPVAMFRDICGILGVGFEVEGQEVKITTSQPNKPEPSPTVPEKLEEPEEPKVVEPIVIDSIELTSTTQNGLQGVTYDGVFYVDLNKSIRDTYNIVVANHDDYYAVAALRDGTMIKLRSNIGYIETSSGTTYFEYDLVKDLMWIRPPAPTPTPMPTTPGPTKTEVAALDVIERNGMVGVVYDGVFYVEWKSFFDKYNIWHEGDKSNELSIIFGPDDSVATIINKNTAKVVTLRDSKGGGLIKNSEGAHYLNLDKLQVFTEGQ